MDKNNNKENELNIVKFEDNENPIDKISELIKQCFDSLKGQDLLITNRRISGDYFSTFADSLYAYEKGIVLLERFFKKDKCKWIGQEYKEFSEKDKELLKEFEEFAHNIPTSIDTTQEERTKYSDKLEGYQGRIKNIAPKIGIINDYMYDDIRLILLDDVEDEGLKNLSNSYSSFGIAMLTTLTWGNINGLSFGITTINYDDYVDLILIPIK